MTQKFDPDALAALLTASAQNKGTMPPVNPPQAQAVLETKTTAEVRGEEVPDLPPAVVPAPVAKPPEVVAAEAVKTPRRTAPVVQAELDTALARIAELEAAPAQSSDAGLADELKSAEEKNEEHARTIAELGSNVSDLAALNQLAGERITELLGQAAKVESGGASTIPEHCQALANAGFEVRLTFKGES